jgi:WD40 repeat protein
MTEPLVALGSPYPGLRPFHEEDAPLFFGRLNQCRDLLTRLDEYRFVGVVGLSGSGKSSIARAGLIPALRRGNLTEGSLRWRVATLRPGSDPVDQLGRALNNTLGPDPSRLETLRRSSFGLIRAARDGRSPDENLLILVDQFEEIFRHTAQESGDFVRLLLTAVGEAQPEYRIYVVVTMRTDYLGDCARFRDLPEALNEAQYLVPRLTWEQRREAIERPANRYGGKIDSQLLQQLMLDAGDDPDQLPILQHLLMRMWTAASSSSDSRIDRARTLTMDHYAEVGGWKNAIEIHGDELLKSLPRSHIPIAQRIFQRVTETGGRDRDRRRVTHLSELCEVCGPTAPVSSVKSVVEHFSRAGADFLTSSDSQTASDPLIDVTHESLIRQWTQLKSWATEEAEWGAWYRRVEDRLNNAGAYLAGGELESAIRAKENGHWTEPWSRRYTAKPRQFSDVVAFLEESHKHRTDELKRLRRTRKLVTLAAVIFATLAVAAGCLLWIAVRSRDEANYEKGRAVRAQKQADKNAATALIRQREAKAEELAAYATQSLNDDPELSLLLGIQAANATLQFNQPVALAAEAVLHRAVLSQVRLTLRGHSDAVLSIAFSPDGKRVVTTSLDKTVKVWDLANGVELLSLGGHSGPAYAVTFSPDGRRLATASADNTAKVWDSTTGEDLLTLRGHSDVVWSVAFSPDGQRIATASQDKTAKVWDSSSGKELLTLRGPAYSAYSINSVAFSPDGTRLATSGGEDNGADVWELASAERLFSLSGHAAPVLRVAFSHDGKRLATASTDNTVKVWDAASGRELRTLHGHSGPVVGLAYSKDDKVLATASLDNTAKVWDAVSGRELLTLRGHSYLVLSVAISPDGKRLATASADGTAKVWGTEGAEELLSLRGHSGPVLRAVFSPDGTRLATAGTDNTARVWDAASGRQLSSLRGHSNSVLNLAFSPDSKHLATSGADDTVKVWETVGERLLFTLRGHQDSVYGVAFDPAGTRLATASADQTAKVWDATNGRLLLTLRGHTKDVWSVAFSPDGKRLATASADQTAIVWDAANGRALLPLRGHEGIVHTVAFSPDGKRLATASSDKTAKVWDATSGQVLLTLRGHADVVWSVAFSPNGKRIATASADKKVKVWDAASGQELLTLGGHPDSVFSVAFNPDGKRLATSGMDGAVQVYALDIHDLLRLAERRVARSLTFEECQRYLQNPTCPTAP